VVDAGGGAAATMVMAVATRGACLDILFCIAMCRAPTPPTAVNFFFEGMMPVLLPGIEFGLLYINDIIINNQLNN
jgi:hypothetical protein